MVIKSIKNKNLYYEVGKDGLLSIEPSNQGSKHNTTYKLTFDNHRNLFVGFRGEHEVEYQE